ncbi:MAG: hypothetical protein PWQ15_187 [Methanobacterium sp.]|jgi:4-amino-4-deoxy-L-arabinose transferase-like glycosyltransferase|uniref:ArnT family glycosyltransferase n=1 Tax=Methanobacterium sp. TaxID=2164 RepID=UPI0003C97902|nr:glycosyltransferase family 39 protein [Methanobacterium sp.]MDI3549085.1 hypothetical protein [Methanobacterium sp.]CDG64285.1 putative membrane protein [Methanobacterium sp. MB1]
MNISTNSTQIKRILLVIPALVALCIALIPTLKYQLPLSWDVYYHVHMAKLYLDQGFTLWDSLSYAPFGRPIYYPPLFHMFIGLWGQLFNGDIFTGVRFLQPLLAFGVVFSFTYLAYRVYGLSVSFVAGFLIIMTLPFHRFMLPIPESLALIFLSLSICSYYLSLKDKRVNYGIIAGILAGLDFLIHPSTALILIMVISLYTLILRLSRKNYNLSTFWGFILSTLLVASIWWAPLILNYGYISSFPTVITPLLDYPRIFGIISLLFSVLGAYILIKRREKGDLLVLTWLISLLVVSQIYLLGIDVLNDRILNFAVFPLVLTAAVGINYFKDKNKWIFYGLTLFIIIIAVPSGFLAAENSKPYPTSSQMEVVHWFEENSEGQGVVIATDLKIEPIILAFSGQPVAGGGYGVAKIQELDRQKYMNFQYTLEDLKEDHLAYLVFNQDQKKPPYSDLVYQNQDYKIFRMKY